MADSHKISFFEYVFRFRAKQRQQDFRQLRAVITYQFMLACMAVFLLAAIADTLLGVYWLAGGCLLVALAFVGVLYLHYRGHYVWTASIAIVLINLLIFVHDARYGILAGVYFFYFPLFFSIFSTITFRRNLWFAGHLLFTVACWLVMELTNHSLLYEKTHSDEVLHRAFVFCQVVSLSATTAFVYFVFAQIRNNAVSKEREKLKAVVDSNAQLIMLVNREGNIEVFNKNFMDFYQNVYGTTLTVGGNYLGYVHPQNRPLIEKGFRTAFAGEAFKCDAPLAAGDDSVWAKLNFVPVFGKDGTVRQVAFSVLDITDQKNYEKNLSETNEILTKLNHELDNFIYRSSHDMRAPLTSVLGLVELFQNENDEQDREEYVQLIGKSVQRLDQLLVNITQYAKNKKLEIKRQPIRFEALVNDLVDGLKFSKNAQDIDFQITVAQSGEFQGDEERLRSVVGNLLSNAIRYRSPHGQSFVRVNIQASAAQADITVSDNGIGIEPEYQAKIFDMFFKASVQSAGSGLGLYIVKETVLAMDGTIGVESVQGLGTTFTVKIPNMPTE
ncbi:MAG: PAS domain-containing sensor histidine kinase [Cytophagales bacterium]|nr:PAS domain-containing sensor histidine kinase [Cytophagales bacterium]